MPLHTQDSARAWTVVGAAFMSCFTVFGVAYSFGAFFGPMAREFGTGRSATSLVFSITACLYFVLGIVSGPAVDRVGPRKVLLVGAVVMGSGLLLTSRVDRLWVGYITYGLGVGIGVACGYVPMVAVVGGWFVRRRSLALGLAVAGIGVGTLAAAPLAASLISRYGWRTTYVIFGIASTVVLLGCAAVAERPPLSTVNRMTVGAAARSPTFIALYVSGLLISLALFQVFVFLVPFAEDKGSSRVAASALIGVVGGASVLGRLALGGLADRWGRFRTYQAALGTMAVSFLIWLIAPGYAWLLVFAVVMGVGYGGFIALSPAVVAELFGVEGLGGTIGLLYTSAGIGALVGPPLAGLLIDATGSYRGAIGVAMTLAIASCLVIVPLGRRTRREAAAK